MDLAQPQTLHIKVDCDLSDDTGFSLLEILVVLVILGLMATVPFLSRSGAPSPTLQDVQAFFEKVVALALREGEDQLLYLSPLSVRHEGRELRWQENTGRLSLNAQDANETPVVIYRNGTSSAFVTISTAKGQIPLLTVPRW